MNIKIACSNIRFDNPKDGNHDWNGRRNILADIINDFNPDLLGTQEGRRPQLEDFDSLLENLAMVDHHRDWIPERMYPSIFIDPKKIAVKDSGDIWLSETPKIPGSKSFQSAFPRICTWIKGEFKNSNVPFLYLNCHLDHVLESTRHEQILVLIHESKKINNENLPIILSGDFNEDPKSRVREKLSEYYPNLYDPWMRLGKEETSSHHKFDGEAEDGSRIDWILLDKTFEAKDCFLDTKSVKGIYPSDHYPLLAKLELAKD